MNLKTKLLSKILVLVLLISLIPMYSNKTKATNEVQKTMVAYDISLTYITDNFAIHDFCDKVAKDGDSGGYFDGGNYSGHYGIANASFNKESGGGFYIYRFVYFDDVNEKEHAPQSAEAGYVREPDFYILPEGQSYEEHFDCSSSELDGYIQSAGYGVTNQSFGPITRAETYKVYTKTNSNSTEEYLMKESDNTTVYTYQAHTGDDGNSYNLALRTTAVDPSELTPVMIPEGDTTIDTINVTIINPAVGNTTTNTTKPNILIDSNAGYELDFTAYVTAYPSEMPTGYDAPFIGTFAENNSYYVEVSLKAKDGYVFTDNNHMNLRVNGKTTGFELSQWNMDGSKYYMFWAKINAVTPIPLHNHSYTKDITKANLYNDGIIIEVCACGDVKSTTIIPYIKTAALSKTDFTYNGKVQKPTVTVKDRTGKALKNGTDYTATYSNKNSKKIGEYTVTIAFKGNYEGTKKIKYRINPKGTTLTKVTKGSKKFTATWKAQKTETTGYEIQYATNSNFTSGKKTVKIKKNKTTSTTVKKLKAKKKYYVRIRTYKTVNGKKLYSSWSKSKNVTTKK